MKALIILNSGSGKRKSLFLLSRVVSILEAQLTEYQLLASQNVEHLNQKLKAVIFEQFELVIVLGGDGTLHHSVNSLARCVCLSQLKILLIPTGSGNDYLRSLSFQKARKWWQILASPGDTPVEVGVMSFKESERPARYFMNMVSLGVSAEIAWRKNKMPYWLPAKLKYLIPVFQKAFSLRAFDCHFIADDKEYKDKILALFVSKGAYAGGGLRICENSHLNNGQFELTMIKKMSLLEILPTLVYLLTGKLSKAGCVEKKNISKLKIISAECKWQEADGEIISYPIDEVIIESQKIKILI